MNDVAALAMQRLTTRGWSVGPAFHPPSLDGVRSELLETALSSAGDKPLKATRRLAPRGPEQTVGFVAAPTQSADTTSHVPPQAEPTSSDIARLDAASVVSFVTTPRLHGSRTPDDPPPQPSPDSQLPSSPWDAVADAGVAVSDGSRKAAAASARFFSRFGKSVARSF
jgi:hypothetical protein